MARRLAVGCLLLWCFAGNTLAQTDKPYVLKRQIDGVDHYLTHVNNGGTWVPQDATTFNPATCIWYSGPVFNVSGSHHNYYFIESVQGQADRYHFLTAPLEANQNLSFSASLPTAAQLKNPEDIYYFYDWDQGVARGHYDGVDWTVHWVEYNAEANNWKTSVNAYDITSNGAKFREVTITEHDKAFDWGETQNNIGTLSPFSMDYDSNVGDNGHPLAITIGSYSYTCTPAYTTYTFDGTDHNFMGNTSLGSNTPSPHGPFTGSTASSYTWTISGDGATYLSFSTTTGTGNNVLTSTSATPTLYYVNENTQGRKTAKLTLTMTFGEGDDQATLVRETEVTVNTQCQNPAEAVTPVVNYNDVTVSWFPTATRYKVEWKKTSDENWNNAGSAVVGNVTSYTIHDLDQVDYQYRVSAYCDGAFTPPTNPTGSFTPSEAPDLLIYGSVFGGGRAANVTEKTEVIIVNCDNIGAVYGGNDIAGSAGGNDGSVITLGTDNTEALLKIGSVYGGGNGYYAYGSTTFSEATAGTSSIAPGKKVYALSEELQWTDSVWTNTSDAPVPLPTLKKTSITVNNDYVKVDSLFGGAKNAFVTNSTGDNTTITVNGGTLFAVFGGNNVGGTLGNAHQKITVTDTKKDLTTTTGLGRTHGIGYLFGGGNMVAGHHTDITITGGQLDTIFGGGNAASVDAAYLTVNCVGDKLISGALDGGNFDPGAVSYGWDGNSIYNVHTLFGGNNRANMNGVPYVTLTSGGVGTAYGGGNAGDMLAHVDQTLDDTPVQYGTHMQLNSESMIVDFLYGGCQMSNVYYSTWVEIIDGHVGTVYGGCNVSGDVGSIRTIPGAPAFIDNAANIEYQQVRGATYVKVSGGTVYRDVFAGSNGYYHCNDGIRYVTGLNFGDPDGSPAEYDPNELYVGLTVPTHNETNVKIWGGHIYGNVYAGGNLACVGFTDYTVPEEHTSGSELYPTFVGMAFVQMQGGTVEGDVYGGGKMASVFGSNSVQVSGGIIRGALYGGNDRTGQVAQITNRVLPDEYGKASDGITDLNQLNVKTYVSLTGDPTVGTVYGGGNGDYNYTGVGEDAIQFCGLTPDEPIQANTFVDININGHNVEGENPGNITTVYGGGNGVTVIGGITVLLNVKGADYQPDHDNVTTIFGGNNKGSLSLVPDIILLNGQVNTVYGGCNKGAMEGDFVFSTGGHTYNNIGSLVRLRDEYVFTLKGGYYNEQGQWVQTYTDYTQEVNAKVSHFVYGGCRMNGVTHNSMVIVEGHGDDHINAEIFGGSDISGVVGGTSMVVVNGVNTTGNDLVATQVGNVYAGGNGNYDYLSGEYAGLTPPSCMNTLIDMWSGTAGTLFGGGYAAGVTNTTTVNMNGGFITEGIYGGCYSKGSMGNITVNVIGGEVGSSALLAAGNTTDVFGGGYGNLTSSTGNIEVNITRATGDNPPVAPIIYGDVYGGSGFGNVNTDGNNTTVVNVFDGTIKKGTYNGQSYGGNVYGGGLGDVAGASGHNDYPALVNGKVYVNIGSIDDDGVLSGNATIEGSVYGCNNVNGTPLDDVLVNIYKTAHVSTPQNNYYPTLPAGTSWTLALLEENSSTQAYALEAVYGGGNKASYKPLSAGEPKSATVHVWGCQENTIDDVYGGGNAADMGTSSVGANTFVIIDGGRINRVFGGGNGAGTGNPGANIYGTATTTIKAGLINQIFGGGNERGTITATNLTVNNESDCSDEVLLEIFGGGNLAPIATNTGVRAVVECGTKLVGDIYGGSNKAQITGDVTLDIRGGTFNNVFGGSKGETGGTAANINGNVKLNLEGGEIVNAFGGSNYNGNITGNITVNVVDQEGDCGLDLTNVYGGGNLTAYTPTNPTISSPVVNVIHIAQADGIKGNVFGGAKGSTAMVTANPIVNIGYNATTMSNYVTGLTIPTSPRAYVKGNVFGGGDAAPVDGSTTVNVFKGEIVHKLVGGGNDIATSSTNPAGVSGDVTVNITGGEICTEPTGIDAGIYGGCNTSGTVGGNVIVNILGSTTSPTTIGTIAALEHAYDPAHIHNPVSVHGGGYGAGTEVKGNVTVNFGEDDGSENSQCDYPVLYGDLYGGSALGTVNDGSEDQTTVNVLNGIINGGNVFGGGLGDDNHAAKVWGVVHVNIGAPPAESSTNFRGQASFRSMMINDVNIGGDVYGCNNKNGSPQQDVYVDVYKTAHTEKDTYTYLEIDRTYAIANVYGGGKKAVYAPDENPEKKLHTYIHNCDNTIGYVYGGCDAADAQGAVVTVDGGRFNFIFGGGNGQTVPANITGNVELSIYGGRVGWYFVGCNLHGEILGTGVVHIGCPTGYEPHCDELEVENYYFGANEALTVGGLEHVIECEDAVNGNLMNFVKVFAGSRLAVVYGDIKLTVRGGEIQNLFGGSEGSATVSADVRKFPDNEAGIDDLPADHQAMVREYLATHPHDYGKGGNITLILEGGTIHNVFGGNDIQGNIQGVVNIIVNDRNLPCPLNIDYIYGGNNQSLYEPSNIVVGGVTQKPITPIVEVVNGTVNYDVFGGSLGGDATIVNAGRITCNPKVVIGDGMPNSTNVAHIGHLNYDDVYYGDVYGGGSSGEVVGNTKVILQGNATIDDNVFGGAKNAQVTGSTNVVLGPKMHKLTITQPASGGTIAVYTSIGVQVNDGDYVPEDAYLRLVATPTAATSAGGYIFNQWSYSGAGSIIDHLSWANSSFTVGTADAELSASFTSVPAKQLTMVLGTAGAGSLFVDGNAYTSPVWVAENSSIRVQAIPSPTTSVGGYVFNHWEIAEGTGAGASISSSSSATTDFNMGTAHATLTAYFDHLLAHTLTIASSGLPDGVSATFAVNGTTYSSPVYVAESTSVTVMVTPPEGYVFSGWTIAGTGANIDNIVSPVTHCTMGTGDAVLTANFTPSRRTDNNVNE